ncbi:MULTISPECIES: response regulator [Streptomyces]|uniref:response regulator n=1 Tax=Streptomyces TaxID=1883 RepID=UPI0006AE1421|nr:MULTISPECIES: response regulator transcription factor [Streptomyces]GLV89478.1 DNA-binding response regulator [Streptomyces lavendulae subsp. lavendulae]MBP2345391.1 DNA-binding NarL/FixJ family response regulator [Streptomyces virginiae]QNE26308.1 response regulator transcription factor [Streptomyces sp. INR7]RST15198.1 DNA-binding response regulator [Streptomyces sp. WAC05950]GGP86178.1 DNA-binding response regulator [Streptomyces virginiae]
MTAPARPIRVLLADDETMIRHGVRLILRHAGDIDVVAEAADGRQAVELAAAHRPDVALVDIRMPVCDGLAAIAPLLALDPAPRVVMLTTFGDEDNVVRALREGATGFLLKDEGPQELIGAVRAAAAGDAVLSPGVTGSVIARMLRGGDRDDRGGAPTDERIARLTVREREVLSMLGEGLSNQDIAGRLGIGIGTVKTHVGAILEKTGSASRVQAALLAHRTGLAS